MSSKHNSLHERTLKTAFGAVLTALGVVLLYIGAVTDILDLSLCALACMICVFAMIELGVGYSFFIYVGTLLLSALLLPTKLAVLEYAFMGLYALIKPRIERLDRIPAWFLKLLYFNAAALLGFFGAKYIFMLPDEGKVVDVLLLVLGNAAFVLFDIALTKLTIFYVYRLRKRLNIEKYFKR